MRFVGRRVNTPDSSPAPALSRSSDVELLEKAAAANKKLHEAISARVVGQEAVVDSMLVSLLARDLPAG